MAVVLIIITFAVFITIDWFINHGKAPALSFAEAHAGSQEPTDDMIAGFHLPKSLRYHPGHTWVQRERKNLNRVGADEFAAIFAGPVDRVELPKPGTWVRQGQKAISFFRNGGNITRSNRDQRGVGRRRFRGGLRPPRTCGHTRPD